MRPQLWFSLCTVRRRVSCFATAWSMELMVHGAHGNSMPCMASPDAAPPAPRRRGDPDAASARTRTGAGTPERAQSKYCISHLFGLVLGFFTPRVGDPTEHPPCLFSGVSVEAGPRQEEAWLSTRSAPLTAARPLARKPAPARCLSTARLQPQRCSSSLGGSSKSFGLSLSASMRSPG